MDRFESKDIRVFDKFIEKFASKYVDQRMMIKASELIQSPDCGFNTDLLSKVIQKNCVHYDEHREEGERPSVLNDIYRSDFGELLMTYYYEEKIENAEGRFIIPLKNISYRERADMPGRGFDALGYRQEESGIINVLIGEAKVSSQRENPPAVVDKTNDSLYKSQKMHHDNTPMVLRILSDYVRRLSGKHLSALGCVVLSMEANHPEKYHMTYGCALVRDETCVDTTKDFGKLQTNTDEFRPGDVNFIIFSLTEKTIDETVDLFYQKVQEIVNNE